MVVDVTGERDSQKRVEVIKNRLEYEKDSEAFAQKCESQQQELRNRIRKAQELLDEVTYDDSILEMAAKISIEMEVDGHRADIAMLTTAMTIAAFNGRNKVSNTDLLEAGELVLPHRMKKTPFEEGIFNISKVKDVIEQAHQG